MMPHFLDLKHATYLVTLYFSSMIQSMTLFVRFETRKRGPVSEFQILCHQCLTFSAQCEEREPAL